jgi:hypothetical protein
VTVRLADGRVEEATVFTPRGSEARPLTDAELEAKYHENAALGGCADRAAAQIAAIWALEEAPDLKHLMALLA